jgi:acetyl-CoA synthetase
MSAAAKPQQEQNGQTVHLSNAQYLDLYQESISDPEGFWKREAQRISWSKPFVQVKNTSFQKGAVRIRWFEDGELNACFNCVDRHLPEKAAQVAFYWEPDAPGEGLAITYAELHEQVCRFANVLKAQGVGKGDRVIIYLPMIPEAVYSMLACARIGAIHSVIFAGFSPNAIADRICDSTATVVITADEGLRGGRKVPLKRNVDEALDLPGTDSVARVLVVQHTGAAIDWKERDLNLHEAARAVEPSCAAEPMNAEDPLFILYTSGSTGKPKGVLHTTGGYMVYAAITHQSIFAHQPGDVYWCGADVGWITGHTYVVYGPLANGATNVMYEGIPTYPEINRYGQIVDKYQVTAFYTAPTAIRALMACGEAAVAGSQRDSLKILATAGEPINPEAWNWFHDQFGKGKCPIMDTWWQTETGGVMITPLPGATELKPGSATRPFFGIQPALVDTEGKLLAGKAEGALVILDSWPGQMRTVYGDHERFEQTYFSTFEGMYFSGDGARMDEDGYLWITGRMDDVLNVAGHRLGTAEIESCLVAHPSIAEAAVVGFPHDLKGQGIYVYVTPRENVEVSDELTRELIQKIRKELSPIATPDQIQWTRGLPKTRSGKIMRRILRKIACNEADQLGDTSTLADPTVVDDLIAHRCAV